MISAGRMRAARSETLAPLPTPFPAPRPVRCRERPCVCCSYAFLLGVFGDNKAWLGRPCDPPPPSLPPPLPAPSPLPPPAPPRCKAAQREGVRSHAPLPHWRPQRPWKALLGPCLSPAIRSRSVALGAPASRAAKKEPPNRSAARPPGFRNAPHGPSGPGGGPLSPARRLPCRVEGASACKRPAPWADRVRPRSQ